MKAVPAALQNNVMLLPLEEFELFAPWQAVEKRKVALGLCFSGAMTSSVGAKSL